MTDYTESADQYRHTNQSRPNNPDEGLVNNDTDPDQGEQTLYQYHDDVHGDPQLSWAKKTEHTSFEVPKVSLHVHERIDPKNVLKSVRNDWDQAQRSLFETRRPLHEALDFYKHEDNWSNRMIAGDSLLVMNSLLEKESMGGKVQMIYFDPPYGIKYGSNFQTSTKSRDVKDGKDDHLSTEPEMIRAFRDTWELGIHSYLSYMRDRLLLAKDLLHESGSIFVQIGDENVHRVGLLLDEVFGPENKVATIAYATTSGSSSKILPSVTNYILWFGKDKDHLKYHQLYEMLSRKEMIRLLGWNARVELADGTSRKLTSEEIDDPDAQLPRESRVYRRTPLDSQGISETGRSEPFVWEGRQYHCPKNRHWSISFEGMEQLGALGRLSTEDNSTSLSWKKYESEIPGRTVNNIWRFRMHPSEKRYVVQTAKATIQRCLLMTTDPGDLVLDITCGSGTTAYVAEQWGRRWMTCDTSRIALNIAKQRLMTGQFDYYKLAHPKEGVASGFVYKTVEKVTPSTLGYGTPPIMVTLYDQPLIDPKRTRVSSPFTVESIPAISAKAVDDLEPNNTDNDCTEARQGETLRQDEWRQELLKTGVRGKNGKKIKFSRVELLQGSHYIQAEAETLEAEPKKVLVVFGPPYAPMSRMMVERAYQDARRITCDLLLFCSFQFSIEATKEIESMLPQLASFQLLKSVMNPDLYTNDLRKARSSNESFWLVGQPDVKVKKLKKNTYQVTVRGFDYYDPQKGEIAPGGPDRIALWMLDTDYDDRSLVPQQIFFPLADKKDGWAKLAKSLKAKIDTDKMEAFRGTNSLPFKAGSYHKIAVKIVDDRGIESLRVFDLTTL